MLFSIVIFFSRTLTECLIFNSKGTSSRLNIPGRRSALNDLVDKNLFLFVYCRMQQIKNGFFDFDNVIVVTVLSDLILLIVIF